MRYLMGLWCILVLSSAVWANDAAVYGVSGSVALMDEHSSIQMVREKVNISLGQKAAKVRCEFVFKNDGPATTVRIGFPEKAEGDVVNPESSRFLSFESWVDGEPITTRYVKESENDPQNYNAWHVKDVSFGKGQERIVVDEYVSYYGGISDGSRFVTYVLRTGKSWHGPIGKAEVVIDAAKVPKYINVSPTIGPCQTKLARHGDVFTWTAVDFEPAEDVNVLLTPKYPTLNDRQIWGGECSPYFVRDGIAWCSPMFLSCEGIAGVERRDGGCLIRYGGSEYLIKPGASYVMVNGKDKIDLPETPFVERYRLVVPIAAVIRALGGRAEFDKEDCQVELYLEPRISE